MSYEEKTAITDDYEEHKEEENTTANNVVLSNLGTPIPSDSSYVVPIYTDPSLDNIPPILPQIERIISENIANIEKDDTNTSLDNEQKKGRKNKDKDSDINEEIDDLFTNKKKKKVNKSFPEDADLDEDNNDINDSQQDDASSLSDNISATDNNNNDNNNEPLQTMGDLFGDWLSQYQDDTMDDVENKDRD